MSATHQDVPQAPDHQAPPALSVRGLSKAFGSTQALDDFSFELRRGEVHALVGGNGSGKSTFIKILAGVETADQGELTTAFGTEPLADFRPERSQRVGLRFVHQNLGVIPALSLEDNLALGHGFPTDATGRIQWREWRRYVRETLATYGIDADPQDSASMLSMPQLAMLAVARVLQDLDHIDQAILVFDEPTASLPQREALELLTSIRRLADQGASVIFVTHRLEEVQLVADRVTALRDGIYCGTEDARSMSRAEIVALLLGRPVAELSERAASTFAGEPVLELKGASAGPIHDVDLTVRAGECVGVAGLLGSGRTELLELIYGVTPLASGELHVRGAAVTRPRPGVMMGHGVAMVPEDRPGSGVIAGFSVGENMTAGHLEQYVRTGWIRDRAMRSEVDRDLTRFTVKAASADVPIETLSGGNQQKVVIARWLREQPALLLLDEPTQGIDVGAREEIYSLIAQAQAQGTAVVVVSSEFEELTRLCDRIVILSGGALVDEVGHDITAHQLFERVLTHSSSTTSTLAG